MITTELTTDAARQVMELAANFRQGLESFQDSGRTYGKDNRSEVSSAREMAYLANFVSNLRHELIEIGHARTIEAANELQLIIWHHCEMAARLLIGTHDPDEVRDALLCPICDGAAEKQMNRFTELARMIEEDAN